jgi:hypothetical protein
MPKKAKQVMAFHVGGPCPNPQCSSHPRVFKHLQKHIAQKVECIQFMHEQRQKGVAQLGPEVFGATPFNTLVCLPTNHQHVNNRKPKTSTKTVLEFPLTPRKLEKDCSLPRSTTMSWKRHDMNSPTLFEK